MEVYTNKLISTLEDVDTGDITPTDIDLLLVHGDITFLEDSFFLNKLKEAMPNAQIIGCSSVGEFINDDADEGTIIYSAIDLDKTRLKPSRVVKNSKVQTDYEAGQVISRDLSAPDLKCILLFYDVFAVDSDEFIKGVESLLPSGIPILGGAAADNFEFERTIVIDRNGVYDDGMVALGLYGDSLVVNTKSSYFDQEGLFVNITKVDENKVFEINGQPAATEYKKLLNGQEHLLPNIAALYPFVFLDSDDNPLYCRKVIQVIEEEDALLFSLPMPLGKFRVVDLSEEGMFLKDAQRTVGEVVDAKNEFSYIISCCARRGEIGNLSSAEATIMSETLEGCPMIGFYSYSEIGRSSDDSENIVNNITVTIGTFYEV